MIKISLDNQEAAFLPGESISGYATWNNIVANAEKIEIRLIWHTNGKGDQDCEILNSIESSSPKTNGELQFNFIAPHRPYSFSGQLISLTWAIEVLVFPGLEAQQAELVISNDKQEITLYS